MACVGNMGASLDKFAMEFVDRTRQLKSLVLLRSSQPSEQTDQVVAPPSPIPFRRSHLLRTDVHKQSAHALDTTGWCGGRSVDGPWSAKTGPAARAREEGCTPRVAVATEQSAPSADPRGARGVAPQGREDDEPTQVQDRRGDPGGEACGVSRGAVQAADGEGELLQGPPPCKHAAASCRGQAGRGVW